MTVPQTTTFDGDRGSITVHSWPNSEASHIAVLAHGYAEHARRYDHVAEALVKAGAVVYAPDHYGHGESDGPRAVIDDVESMVDDVRAVADTARAEHPGLPVVLIGHSMGGVIATRFAQRSGHGLAALVLSGPVIGGNPEIAGLLALPEIPEVPIDPALLSRDPEVGEAYLADPLVYTGPFERVTIESLTDVDAITGAGSLDVPTLWMHGEEDGLAPLAATRPVIEQIRGPQLDEQVWPGARHEIFNETNRGEVIDRMLAFIGSAVAVEPLARES